MAEIEAKRPERTIESYRDLRVWESSIELTVACYKTTESFPTIETYGLTSQIRQATARLPPTSPKVTVETILVHTSSSFASRKGH